MFFNCCRLLIEKKTNREIAIPKNKIAEYLRIWVLVIELQFKKIVGKEP